MADYGTDISTYSYNGLDPTFTVISGPRVLVEHIARMLETPEGLYADDPEFAYLLANEINAPQTPQKLATLSGKIAAKIKLDERVEDADVTTSFDAAARRLRVQVMIWPIDGQPFRFVLSIDAVTIEILEGDFE